MIITRNNLPKSIIELVIEESAENIAKFRKKAISNLQKKAEIKGFRKGVLIPENIILRHYGDEYVNSLTVEYAIDELYRNALLKENIIPVAQAEIKEVRSQSPLIFVAHIEILPQVEITNEYKNIKFKKSPISVSNNEVEEALESIKTRFTNFEEVNDENFEVRMGDKITIDTAGYDLNGTFLDSTKMSDYPLVLGSKILVPGFEEGLVGAKLGQDLDLDIEFPKDYHNSSFAGKKTKFKVKIKKIEKFVKPEFTADFIKRLRGKDLDLEQFKELVKEEIRETKEANQRIEEETKLIESLLKISKLDLGDGLIKNQIEKVFSEIKENITKDGLKVSDYLDSLNMSEDNYKEINVKPIALKRLHGELILHKLMELEKIEVLDEQVKKEIDVILSRFDSEDVLKRLRELYVPETKYYEELKQRIAYRNLIDSFFE